jgi:energy-coupling factor transport system ATP-binding protein
MLSFDHVSYRYPGAADPALADVTFTVAPGEHVVLLGSNGSGKSTLAHLANGLLLPEEGTVSADGLTTSEKTTIRQLRSQVGVIAQDPDNQIVSTTVRDEVAFGPENLSLPREVILERVTNALESLGLSGFEERDPNSLSGGEKQRLVVAGILAMNPVYLVLDEPTSMLDKIGRAEVRNAIGALHVRGHGILHITHDLNYARDANKVLVLNEGTLVFAGPPSALLNNENLLIAYGLKVAGSNQVVREQPVRNQLMQTLRPVTAPDRWQQRGGAFPSLFLNNVTYSYAINTDAEHEVLKGVNLNIAPGSCTLISGTTGSGKSTLLRILSGLLEPTMGNATFSDGSKIFPSAVGIVFQHPESQLFGQTVEDEIAFGPNNLGLIPNKTVRANIVREALDAVGLDPKVFFHRSPFSLSGGEMRRVAIASVLAMRPTFLLLDEPTAGLDAKGRAFIHELIKQLVNATAGVVVVSHDVEEFESQVNDHLLLKDGRLWHL